jgi:hypothetical protein
MSVYFALAPNGLVKIGYSLNPLSRIKGLRCESSTPLKLLAVIDGDKEEERRTHMRFGKYYFRGEWFFYRGSLKRFIQRQPLPPQSDYSPTGTAGQMSPEYVRIMTARFQEKHGWTEERARLHVLVLGPPGGRRKTGWPRATLYAVFGKTGAPAGRRPKQAAT